MLLPPSAFARGTALRRSAPDARKRLRYAFMSLFTGDLYGNVRHLLDSAIVITRSAGTLTRVHDNHLALRKSGLAARFEHHFRGPQRAGRQPSNSIQQSRSCACRHRRAKRGGDGTPGVGCLTATPWSARCTQQRAGVAGTAGQPNTGIFGSSADADRGQSPDHLCLHAGASHRRGSFWSGDAGQSGTRLAQRPAARPLRADDGPGSGRLRHRLAAHPGDINPGIRGRRGRVRGQCLGLCVLPRDFRVFRRRD